MEKWFKIKGYPHIGNQIKNKDYSRIKNYIIDKNNIERHSFSPFIHRTSKIRKYRKTYSDGVLINKKRTAQEKYRELYYANHIDSMIYSYYSHLLAEKYKTKLIENSINECVTAYRKIPSDNPKKGKCNIHFANEVFEFIIKNSKNNKHQVVLALDIKGFFDNLNHKKIKESWCEIINKPTLPKHHYQVFKNITKFSYINENELFKVFKNTIEVERFKDSYRKEIITKKKKIDKLKYLKSNRAISYCNPTNDLDKLRKKGLIKSNKRDSNKKIRTIGIPQGSPISANLANIYMLKFDTLINNYVKTKNGLYRRYSDDLVVIINRKHKEETLSKLKNEIISLCNLEIQDKKTQIFHFINRKTRIVCYQEFEKLSTPNRNLEYLGFQFDGQNSYIRNSSISAYYRKMKRNVRRAKSYSKITNNNKTKGVVFKSKLENKFTHIGAERKIKRKRDGKKQFVIDKKHNYGNFISYTKKANKIMINSKINYQLKKHWNKFQIELKK